MSRFTLGRRFELFVQKLFIAKGFEAFVVDSPHERFSFDITAKSPYGANVAIEAKLYSSRIAPFDLLKNASERLEFGRISSELHLAVLVTPAFILQSAQNFLHENERLFLLDLSELRRVAESISSSFLAELEAIERELYSNTSILPEETLRPNNDFEKLFNIPPSLGSRIPPTQTQLGKAICEDLKIIPSGQKYFSQFEAKIVEALKYIFEKDLDYWKTQKSSDTSLSRYDAIAKIISDNQPWSLLAQDFRTRYVIFEFKNHKEKIKQGEIYTTEKYLYPAAMRSTAIVISRKGPALSAIKASRGALREAGR